jgi:hypothetical protein
VYVRFGVFVARVGVCCFLKKVRPSYDLLLNFLLRLGPFFFVFGVVVIGVVVVLCAAGVAW